MAGDSICRKRRPRDTDIPSAMTQRSEQARRLRKSRHGRLSQDRQTGRGPAESGLVMSVFLLGLLRFAECLDAAQVELAGGQGWDKFHSLNNLRNPKVRIPRGGQLLAHGR